MVVTPSSLPDQGRPDPSDQSQRAIDRAVKSERDFFLGKIEVIETRLNGIDEASKVLHETVTRTPTEIQQAITHVRELDDEKFISVEKQFQGRDEAVKAAFSAQEKQALAQEASNKEAINKSERTTTETIKTNQELGKATTDALTKSLDEMKLTVAAIRANKEGSKEVVASLYALAGFVMALLAIGGFLAATGAFTNK